MCQSGNWQRNRGIVWYPVYRMDSMDNPVVFLPVFYAIQKNHVAGNNRLDSSIFYRQAEGFENNE